MGLQRLTLPAVRCSGCIVPRSSSHWICRSDRPVQRESSAEVSHAGRRFISRSVSSSFRLPLLRGDAEPLLAPPSRRHRRVVVKFQFLIRVTAGAKSNLTTTHRRALPESVQQLQLLGVRRRNVPRLPLAAGLANRAAAPSVRRRPSGDLWRAVRHAGA